MLSYAQFSALSPSQQEAFVAAHGTFLARRAKGWFHVDLYHLCGYYCEVWRQLPTARITYLQPFAGQRRLQPYLDLVQLPQQLLA